MLLGWKSDDIHEVNQTAYVMPSGTLDPPSAEMPFLKGSRTCLEGEGSEVDRVLADLRRRRC